MFFFTFLLSKIPEKSITRLNIYIYKQHNFSNIDYKSEY